jgi:MgtC family protein
LAPDLKRTSRLIFASSASTLSDLLEPHANQLYIAWMELLQRLGLALLVGLLIGAERGWQERSATEGERVAGIRTFGLLGLLGGFWALLSYIPPSLRCP